ncbi:MAG TPA: hypothetical protein VLR70_14880, partial [Arthrobacter sp.]|nr:hypothetical protein [Arthrobacter sp.]
SFGCCLVGFDGIYSMLFTGSSAEPAGKYDCMSVRWFSWLYFLLVFSPFSLVSLARRAVR